MSVSDLNPDAIGDALFSAATGTESADDRTTILLAAYAYAKLLRRVESGEVTLIEKENGDWPAWAVRAIRRWVIPTFEHMALNSLALNPEKEPA